MGLQQSFRSRHAQGVALVTIMLLGLAACGGADSDSAADRPSPTPAVTAKSPSPSPAALHARDYVLTEGPETAGLTVDTSGSDTQQGEPEISESEIASCLDVPADQLEGRATDSAEGPDFASSDELTNVGSSAEIYATAAEVERDAAVLARPQVPACLGQVFLKAFQDEAAADGGTATLDSAQRLTAPTGATDAIRVGITATVQGVQVPVTFDTVFIMSGRVESSMFISQVNGTPDPALEQRVTSQVAAKVARQ